jgi:stage II sporulation SpoAA-like protein
VAHTVRIEHRGAYLHATVTGDNTKQDVLAYLADVHEACETHGCSRVLIEENLAGPGLDTLTIYDIVSEGAGRAPPAVTRVAFVDANPAHAGRAMQFAESVAVNRFLSVRVFDDLGAAREWVSA